MPAKLRTEAPPIFTADGHPICVGDVLYGIDVCTKWKREEPTLPKIEPLTVTQVDLGKARSVRLRRGKGTEWMWSAAESRDVCRNSMHLLYRRYGAAKEMAAEAAVAELQRVQSEVAEAKIEYLRLIEGKEKMIARLDLRAKKYSLAISALRRSKSPLGR